MPGVPPASAKNTLLTTQYKKIHNTTIISLLLKSNHFNISTTNSYANFTSNSLHFNTFSKDTDLSYYYDSHNFGAATP